MDLKEDFGGKPFSFIHYLSLFTAVKINKPKRLYFHYKYKPSGEWWNKCKDMVTMVRADPPLEIFGNPFHHFAHKTDVLGLLILLKQGDIFGSGCNMPFAIYTSVKVRLRIDSSKQKRAWEEGIVQCSNTD